MAIKRYIFRGAHTIILRMNGEEMSRRADRKDRGGTQNELDNTAVNLWTSQYTVRRTGLDQLISEVNAWDMIDEHGIKCKILSIALVPPVRPQFIQLFIERAI